MGDNKFLPALVPRAIKNIKYSRKVKVADIKQYLVDEYKLTKELDKENKKLKKELDDAQIIKEKYELTLITLDEYKSRIDSKNNDIKELENKLSKLRDDVKILKDEKNTLTIENKKLSRDNDKIINNFKKEYNKKLIDEIENTKGALSKVRIIDIIEKMK